MKLDHSSAVANRTNGNMIRRTISEAEQRNRVLALSIGLLITRTKTGDFCAEGFVDVARLLETVPLPTSEFEAAQRHLQNAINYGQLSEYGAATFELRLVLGILRRP